MTIIELNIAGYHVTHSSPDFRGLRANWLHGWRGPHRRARAREQGDGPRAA